MGDWPVIAVVVVMAITVTIARILTREGLRDDPPMWWFDLRRDNPPEGGEPPKELHGEHCDSATTGIHRQGPPLPAT